MWAGMEAIAPSLAYDDAVMGDGLVPRDRLASIAVPVLSVAGGASTAWTHAVESDVLGPVLVEFFG